ncbi:uncharacterized protein LOC102720619 [Oryza brachyantha]|nr:uncharacterized protein LOC102720619 [Oryza brachyantha]
MEKTTVVDNIASIISHVSLMINRDLESKSMPELHKSTHIRSIEENHEIHVGRRPTNFSCGPTQQNWAHPSPHPHLRASSSSSTVSRGLARRRRRPKPQPRERPAASFDAPAPPSEHLPPPPLRACAPSRSIFCAEEMSSFENQATEATKVTDDMKMDPPRIKIRIRLPPRKRLTNSLLTDKKEAPDDTSNAPSNRVPAQTKIKIPRKKLTLTAVQHDASSISTRGLCNEGNNNTSSQMPTSEPNCDISSDNLPDAANDSIPSENLTTTAAQHQASSISTRGLCNEANNNTWSKALYGEPNCCISRDKLPEEANDSILCKNLTTTAARHHTILISTRELCNEPNINTLSKILPSQPHYDIPSEKLLEDNDSIRSKNLSINAAQAYTSSISTQGLCNEANNNTLSKTLPSEPTCSEKLPEEANDSIPSKNLAITAGVWGNYVGNYFVKEGLCEEANDNILSKTTHPAPNKELPSKPVESMPSKNLTAMGVLSEEINSHSLRLFQETNIPSKVVLPEKSKNHSRNLTTTAVKCEEANNNILTTKLSDKTKNNTQSNRPTDPHRKNNPQKMLCTSAVHAAHASQNTSEMKMANSEMKHSTSFFQSAEQGINAANFEAIKQYQEFEDKVKRTVYLDYFSHQATETVIKTALSQFGTVREINFLVNYTIPFSIPQSALVIMETEKDAVAVVNMLNEFPFMMSGMPRPVRAVRATSEMFNDRPRKPGTKLEFRWVGSTDADYHIVKKLKLMSRRHELENLALVKHELEEEHFLAKHQEEILNCNQRKLETVDSIMLSGKFNRLSHIYSVSVDEVFCNKWLV